MDRLQQRQTNSSSNPPDLDPETIKLTETISALEMTFESFLPLLPSIDERIFLRNSKRWQKRQAERTYMIQWVLSEAKLFLLSLKHALTALDIKDTDAKSLTVRIIYGSLNGLKRSGLNVIQRRRMR